MDWLPFFSLHVKPRTWSMFVRKLITMNFTSAIYSLSPNVSVCDSSIKYCMTKSINTSNISQTFPSRKQICENPMMVRNICRDTLPATTSVCGILNETNFSQNFSFGDVCWFDIWSLHSFIIDNWRKRDINSNKGSSKKKN